MRFLFSVVLALLVCVVQFLPSANAQTTPLVCDVNNDGLVTDADLLLIRGRLNTPATGPGDPYDANGDGVVNVADMRYCQLRKTASTGSKAGPPK